MKQALQLIFALSCIAVGIDKFYQFLPTCSLANHTPPIGMMTVGAVEIIVGIALAFNKYTMSALWVAFGVMILGIVAHLLTGTYDIGLAVLGFFVGGILIYLHKMDGT